METPNQAIDIASLKIEIDIDIELKIDNGIMLYFFRFFNIENFIYNKNRGAILKLKSLGVKNYFYEIIYIKGFFG